MTTTVITLETIQNEFKLALEQALKIVPLKHWQFVPKSVVSLTKRKKAYGLADYKTSSILVNQFYIGSTELESLRSTLMHELTHLCVGDDEHHNAKFKQYWNAFCYQYCNIVRCHPDNQVRIANKPAFWLVAVMSDGSHEDVKEAHKKHKRYTDYDSSVKKLRLNGVSGHVVSWLYRDNV